MAKKPPVTAAIRALREAGVEYTPHLIRYEEDDGAVAAARAVGVDPHLAIKTLILEQDNSDPLVVLMHGDREVSTKRLARLLETKSVRMCPPETAKRHSGYVVGGTSPFGLRTDMPIYLQVTVADHERILVNAGKRGFLIEMATADLIAELEPHIVDVTAGYSKR